MVFFLSFLFVFVTFGGFVRFIWKFNKHPTNLHTHTHTYTYKNSIRMILLNQCILRLLTNYVRNFFLLFVACSGFLLSCFKNSKRTSVRSIFFFGQPFKIHFIFNIIICHNFEWFVNTTKLVSLK